jgi:hypothetical protein
VAKDVELICGRQELDFEAFVFAFGKMGHADHVDEMLMTGADPRKIGALFMLYQARAGSKKGLFGKQERILGKLIHIPLEIFVAKSHPKPGSPICTLWPCRGRDFITFSGIRSALRYTIRAGCAKVRVSMVRTYGLHILSYASVGSQPDRFPS